MLAEETAPLTSSLDNLSKKIQREFLVIGTFLILPLMATDTKITLSGFTVSFKSIPHLSIYLIIQFTMVISLTLHFFKYILIIRQLELDRSEELVKLNRSQLRDAIKNAKNLYGIGFLNSDNSVIEFFFLGINHEFSLFRFFRIFSAIICIYLATLSLEFHILIADYAATKYVIIFVILVLLAQTALIKAYLIAIAAKRNRYNRANILVGIINTALKDSAIGIIGTIQERNETRLHYNEQNRFGDLKYEFEKLQNTQWLADKFDTEVSVFLNKLVATLRERYSSYVASRKRQGLSESDLNALLAEQTAFEAKISPVEEHLRKHKRVSEYEDFLRYFFSHAKLDTAVGIRTFAGKMVKGYFIGRL